MEKISEGTLPPSVFQRRLLSIAEIVLCSGIPTQLMFGALLVTIGLKPEVAPGVPALPFVFWLSIADVAAVIALMVLLTRARHESVSELWLGGRPIVREALVGFSLVPVVFALVLVLMLSLRAIAPWLQNVAVNPLEQLATGGVGNAIVFGLVAVVAGGVREELQRAFLLRRFQDLGGTAVGVVVLSLAFGALHYPQGYDAMITTGVLGAFWAIVYLRRRSVIAPVVTHAGFNSLGVLRAALADLTAPV
jgi:membrane protease YdiL (CAAX protease family)